MPEVPSPFNEVQAELNRNSGRAMEDLRIDIKDMKSYLAILRDQITTINASDMLGRINNLIAKVERLEADYRVTAQDYLAFKNKLIPLGTIGLMILGAVFAVATKMFGH